MNPDFEIVTEWGRTLTQGDTNSFSPKHSGAVLESFEFEGDFVILKYSGGLTVSIPECRIRYILEIGEKEV